MYRGQLNVEQMCRPMWLNKDARTRCLGTRVRGDTFYNQGSIYRRRD